MSISREEYGAAYEAAREGTIRFLLSRGAPPELATDVAQSAWLRGWEKLSQLRNPQIVVTWVNSIALNHYRNEVRKERLHQEIRESDHGRTSLNVAAIDITRILGACRPQVRQLLEAQMKGVTPRELAREQGLSETAVRIRFLRARRSARKVLNTRRKDFAKANFRSSETLSQEYAA